MTELSEHDQYVTKINGLIESGRGELADEVAAEYAGGEPSGRDAFWGATRSGGWHARTLLAADTSISNADPGQVDGVVLRLPAELAARWRPREVR
jgi:hypothetical protein